MSEATIVSFEAATAARGAGPRRTVTDAQLRARQSSIDIADCHAALSRVSYEIRNKTNRIPLFHDLSVAFPKGRKITILGQKGSGKSVLINLLARQEKPIAGRVHVRSRLSWPLLNLAFVDQRLSLKENALFMAGVLGLDTRSLLEAVISFCEVPHKQLAEPSRNLKPWMLRRMAYILYLSADFDCHIVDGPMMGFYYGVEPEQVAAMRALVFERDHIVALAEVPMMPTNCDLAYVLYEGRLYLFEDVDEAIRIYKALPAPKTPNIRQDSGDGDDSEDEFAQEFM